MGTSQRISAGEPACRGVRGATIATDNSAAEIGGAITELVTHMVESNSIDEYDVGSAFFTTTPDLDAAFPAEAIRHMGWDHVPLLGAVEMAKPGAPGRCIRVLLMWNTDRSPRDIEHVYLRGTEVLLTRPPVRRTGGLANLRALPDRADHGASTS